MKTFPYQKKLQLHLCMLPKPYYYYWDFSLSDYSDNAYSEGLTILRETIIFSFILSVAQQLKYEIKILKQNSLWALCKIEKYFLDFLSW